MAMKEFYFTDVGINICNNYVFYEIVNKRGNARQRLCKRFVVQ